MRCEDCLRLLELYLDREVRRDTRSQISEHLASCENCRARYGALEKEAAFLMENSPAIDLSPAFWSRVSQQAQGVKNSSISTSRVAAFESFLRRLGGMRIGPLWAASIVVCSIGLTSLVMQLINQNRESSSSVVPSEVATIAPARTPGVPASSDASLHAPARPSKIGPRRITQVITRVRATTPDELVRDAERKYLEAIALLSRDANRMRSRTDREQLIQFDQTLAAVDRTIAGTRRAVREHPRDPVAVQYMLTAYAKKVDVLRQMLSD